MRQPAKLPASTPQLIVDGLDDTKDSKRPKLAATCRCSDGLGTLDDRGLQVEIGTNAHFTAGGRCRSSVILRHAVCRRSVAAKMAERKLEEFNIVAAPQARSVRGDRRTVPRFSVSVDLHCLPRQLIGVWSREGGKSQVDGRCDQIRSAKITGSPRRPCDGWAEPGAGCVYPYRYAQAVCVFNERDASCCISCHNHSRACAHPKKKPNSAEMRIHIPLYCASRLC